jgi:hypothetical protein
LSLRDFVKRSITDRWIVRFEMITVARGIQHRLFQFFKYAVVLAQPFALCLRRVTGKHISVRFLTVSW